ncbi:MAG: hypothetical protein AAEJ53_06940, partial [Myxococcota bacterium]
ALDPSGIECSRLPHSRSTRWACNKEPAARERVSPGAFEPAALEGATALKPLEPGLQLTDDLGVICEDVDGLAGVLVEVG